MQRSKQFEAPNVRRWLLIEMSDNWVQEQGADNGKETALKSAKRKLKLKIEKLKE